MIALIFLVRRATGFFASAALIAYIVFLCRLDLKLKSLMLLVVPIGCLLCMGMYASVGFYQKMHIETTNEKVKEQETTDMGHPFYHALLYGLTKIKDPNFPKSEPQVFSRVIAHGDNIKVNTKQYYDAAREIYFNYITQNVIKVSFYYVDNIWKTAKISFAKHNISDWIFYFCYILVLLGFILQKPRGTLYFANALLGYVLFFLPATLMTSLVWAGVSSPDSLTASLMIIIASSMATVVIAEYLALTRLKNINLKNSRFYLNITYVFSNVFRRA